MSLNDLPAEVILDHLLPELSTRDLFTISRVNREFHALANDETLWARLTLRDHRYAPTSLAPPDSSSGWSKRVYLGLDSPRLFVWGASDRHRLGISDQVMSGGQVIRRHRNSIDAPAEHPPFSSGRGETWSENLGRTLAAAVGLAGSGKRVERSNARLVELQSGGWSFTARDAEGGVWVWGTLDGSIISFRSASWAEPACPVPTPSKIPLPCQAESISSGRNHLLVLDRDNLIWELKAWGRAYHHTSSLLTAPTATGSSRKHIKQISTGWSHSACLSADGEIYVWYPFSAEYTGALTPDDQLNDVSRTSDGSNPSDEEDERPDPRGLKWGTVGNIITTLEGLSLRPDLGDDSGEVEHVGTEVWKAYDENTPEKQKELDQKVVKIASGLDCIIALKANGEVWYRRVKEGESSAEWEYLPYFSGPTITHLTAQYTTLTTYSSSSIYHTKLPEGRTAMSGVQSTNIQGLQAALGDKRIIQVACGDYHNLALTSTGDLYSWGTNDYGQLGLGYTGPAVENPVKVNFKRTTDEDEGEGEAFVFGITAAGHHSGALVLGRGGAKPSVDPRVKSTETISTGSQDVQGGDDHRDSDPSEGHGMPGDWPQTQTGLETQGTFNGGGRGMPMFRIGFAGRGASIGGGRLGPGPARQWRPRGGAE